jgi:hypothetical protein
MKDNIIFSLRDLRGLCGEKITFLQWGYFESVMGMGSSVRREGEVMTPIYRKG